MNIKITQVVVSVLGFALIIGTEPLYQKKLFDQSLTYIPNIQKDVEQSDIGFWNIYAKYGYWAIQYLPIAIFFLRTGQRNRAYYYLAAWAANSFLQNFTKLSYHDARPFWVAADVQAFHCSEQFGNPSGHCEACLGRSLLLWLDYVYSCKEGPMSWVAIKVLALFSCLLFAFSIGYSRLFLGVHSLDQVLFGYLLGLWFCLTWFFLVTNWLTVEVNKILHHLTKQFTKRYIATSVLLFVLVAASVIDYVIVNASLEIDPVWDAQIALKCGGSKALTNAYATHSLFDFGEGLVAVGAIYGMLLQSQVWGGIWIFNAPEKLPFLKMIGRASIALIISFPILGLALLTKSDIKNEYVLFFLASFIPMLSFGFILFGLVDRYCLKLQLYDQSTMRHFENGGAYLPTELDQSGEKRNIIEVQRKFDDNFSPI